MDTTQISFFKDEGKDELRTLYCKDALYRSSYIHDVKYRIAYALLPGGKTFHGSVQISFELDEIPSENTFLDYTGQKVFLLEINGNKVSFDEKPF